MWQQLFKREPKKPAPIVIDTTSPTIVEEIHREFMTASEKALAEARQILETVNHDHIQKANRLERLGFKSAAIVQIAQKEKEKESANSKTAQIIMNYQERYPNYKFITEENVTVICKKYGLLCGPVSKYVGSVPEKNLTEIEAFKLRNEDIVYMITPSRVEFSYNINTDAMKKAQAYIQKHFKPIYKTEYERKYNYYSSDLTEKVREVLREYSKDAAEYVRDTDQNIEPAPLCICAPASDFDMKNVEQHGAFLDTKPDIRYSIQEVPDPVVLQRVPNGFLIVTAWGPEASDELVRNEKMN